MFDTGKVRLLDLRSQVENLPVWGKVKEDVYLMHSLPVPQETRFVDGRAILQWDIIASNGLLHIISEPLKAPPRAAVSAQAPSEEQENPQVKHALPRSPPASLLIKKEKDESDDQWGSGGSEKC